MTSSSAPTLDTERTTLTLDESLDLTSAGPLLEAARAAVLRGRTVSVDCRAPGFIPFAVAQVIVILGRECRARGIPLFLEGPQEAAAAHLRRAGVLDFFPNSVERPEHERVVKQQ